VLQDSVASELVSAGKSKAGEGAHAGKNGITREALQIVEGGTLPKNGIIYEGQVAAKLSPKHGKAAGMRHTGPSDILESAPTAFTMANAKSEGAIEGVNLTAENGEHVEEKSNHFEQNGHHLEGSRELSRKRCRGGGNAPDQNGDTSEHLADGISRNCAKPAESTSVSLMSWKAEENEENRTHSATDVESARREVDTDVHLKISTEDNVREEAGCVLWDLAATESQAEFLVLSQIQNSETFLIDSVSNWGTFSRLECVLQSF
jgi:hypothetical protein